MVSAERKAENRNSSQNWEGADFQLNKAFWNFWGHDAALPLRLANLTVIQKTLADSGVLCGLYGRSLKDAVSYRELREDHDDDVAVNIGLPEVLKILSRELPPEFTVIRSNAEMLSVERWGRYVDFHQLDLRTLEDMRIHGEVIQIPANAKDVLLAKYRPGEGGNACEIALRMVDFFRRSSRLRLKALSKIGSTPTLLTQKVALLFFAIFRAIKGFRYKRKVLSLHDFLNLQVDGAKALNWSWRGQHLRQVALPGLTFGQLLDQPVVAESLTAVVEVDMSRLHDEPIHLSRSFWKGGNNFFLYPYLYGFRHLVFPYQAANLYIRNIAEPMLYSAEYFESLTPMSEEEIERFLSSRPLEIRGGALTSGRHRAIAMLGRISRGEDYIPMPAMVRRRFFD